MNFTGKFLELSCVSVAPCVTSHGQLVTADCWCLEKASHFPRSGSLATPSVLGGVRVGAGHRQLGQLTPDLLCSLSTQPRKLLLLPGDIP